MEIRQLEYFLSVARHLSFTKAAEECFVVQTTITHQISALERELGVKLFERTKRSVVITEYGKALLEQAKTIVNTASESVTKITCFKNNFQHSLNIGYWGNVFSGYMPKVLRKFRERYPNTQVVLHQENVVQLLDMLEKGAIDIIISCHFDAWSEISWLSEKILFEDDLYFVFGKGHPLAGQAAVSVSQLTRDPILTFGGVNVEDLKSRCQQAGCSANIVLELEDHQSIMYLIEAGYGVTLCAYHCIPRDNPNIAYARISGDRTTVKIAQYWSRYTQNEAVGWFRSITDNFDFNDKKK